MSFFSELNRRNVFRVGAAYVVTAWLLIQVAETIFPLFGYGDTPARIVVVVFAIGLIPTLVLAWAFEWTPEGLKRDAEVDRGRPVAVDNAKRLDRIIMAVLALALAYFVFDKFVVDPARDAALIEETVQQARSDVLVESYGAHSVAVLPFENLSDDPKQEYFSDGMAEELLNLLAQVPRLRVISRSSSFAFKGQAINVPTIAEQLGVNHVIEGSVRRHGDRIRITAQLIEARSDTHLWSQTYERRLEDVFAIQDEISAEIAGELEAALGLDVGDSPHIQAQANTEAYDAYLRGKYLLAQRNSDSMAAAVEEFSRAVKLDPDYALGHAALAISTGFLVEYGPLTLSEADARARPHAERALELDPGLAEAHAAMAHVNWGPETRSVHQEHLRRAIELNPNYAEAHLWLGNSLGWERKYSESFALQKKAAQLDPLSIPARLTLYGNFLARGRLDEARGELDSLARLDPNGTYVVALIVMKSLGGNWADGALASLDGAQSGDWWAASNLLLHCALMGLEPEATADIAAMGFDLEGEPPAWVRRNTVWVLRFLGRPGEAARALERIPGEDNQYLQLLYGRTLAGAGEYARAGPVLEQLWQGVDRIGLPWQDSEFALALIAARRERGGEAGIAELELALSDAVRRYDEAEMVECDALRGCVHFDRGISAYLAGNRDEGLAWIKKAVDSGYFIPPNHAYLQFLYDDPGFAPIREKQKAHQASEREKFLSVVCNDNPYAEVWQPVEGTCKAHLAAD